MQDLINRVLSASEANTKILASGSTSQPSLNDKTTQLIDMTGYDQVIDYQPEELFIRVQAGIPVQRLTEILAEKNQFLANSPPILSNENTVGGMVAGNLSTSTRLGYGSVKDQILGVGMINGLGQYLEFGGQVMKNVAGFDSSRLLTGSGGAYGIIHDVSLKVLPKPQQTHTFIVNEPDTARALHRANDLQHHPISIIAAAYDSAHLYIMIEGSDKAKELAQREIGASLSDNPTIWQELNDYSHPIFNTEQNLWRILCDPLATLHITGQTLYDWGGSLRFVATEQADDSVLNALEKAGAMGKLWQGDHRGIQSQVAPLNQKYIKRLKSAFDPNNVFDDSNLPCA